MAFIPIGNRPIVFLDTETTGLEAKHEMLSIALVFDRETAEQFHLPYLTYEEDYAYFFSLIKPQHIEIAEPKALEVNGYAAHPEKWNNAPSFGEIAGNIQVLIKDAVPVGHNSRFDAEFIQVAFQRLGSSFRVPYNTVDTQALAFTNLVPAGLERLSLDAIREFLGWSKEGNHEALQDALDARRLYKLLTQNVPVLDRAAWMSKACQPLSLF